MSARILVAEGEGATAILRSSGKQEAPLAPLEKPGSFDQKCGTFGAFKYSEPSNQAALCSGMPLVCPGETSKQSDLFESCLKAIDCKMMDEMQIKVDDDDHLVTFMHQMIPHHVSPSFVSHVVHEK